MAKPVPKRAAAVVTSHRVVIEDVAFGGDGVARLDNSKVCFVPGVLPGEEADVHVYEHRSSFAFARVSQMHKPSPHRIAPECPYFYYCGGCQYGHASYEYEVQLKHKQLEELLKRIAGIVTPVRVVASPRSDHYRNTITLHATTGGKLGFVSVDQQNIIDIKQCHIASPVLNAYLQENREELRALKRDDIVLKTDGTGVSTLKAPKVLYYQYGERKIQYDAYCFFQTNTEMLTLMLDHLRAQVQNGQVLFDLYCGVGVFAVCLADMFTKVVGVEHGRRAVQFAQINSFGLAHVHIAKGKVEDKIASVYGKHSAKEGMGPQIVLVDPPRQGLEPSLLNWLLKNSLWDQWVYVSCEPSTLCRDLKKILASGSYRIKDICLFDMFPRTKHFETVVILEKV